MKKKELLKIFDKNLQYYDRTYRELKAILEFIEFQKNQELIDVGAGIGRLSVPISFRLNVLALEPNKNLADKINEHNIEVITKKIENFFPSEKFDYALFAWPGLLNYGEVFKHIRKEILNANGRLIVIKPIEHSLKQIACALSPQDFDAGGQFFEVLSDFFIIEKEKEFKTT